jgi:hypothetical protein
MTNNLVETPSGLLVPETIEPVTSVIDPYSILFQSKYSAEQFVKRCAIRWEYAIGVYNAAREDDTPNWRPLARKTRGVVHDTTSPAYIKDDADVGLEAYISIDKYNDHYRIVNKF